MSHKPPPHMPEPLARAAHAYQVQHQCALRDVAPHFRATVDELKLAFRRLGLYCIKARDPKRSHHAKLPPPENRPPLVEHVTDDLVRTAHAWYMAQDRGTMIEAAVRHGIKPDTLRKRMQALGLPIRPQSGQRPDDVDFVQPFRSQIHDWDRERAKRLANGA